MVELNKRLMSPVEFTQEFRSFLLEQEKGRPRKQLESHAESRRLLQNVSKHFRVLARLECIELVSIKTGQGRRGGQEHVYRAVQRTLFDASSWPVLPRAGKGDVTAVALSSYVEQVASAVQAGTIDARDDRHFTWTALFYDRQGWHELVAEIDALFVRSLELRIEAGVRLAKSGEPAIPVTVGLSCFELPNSIVPAELTGAGLAKARPPASRPEATAVDPNVAKVMTHPSRVRIMVEMNKRPTMSPTQFAWEVGGQSLSNICRHFRLLEKADCIEVSHIETGGRRRGAKERFFRAVKRPLFEGPVWASLPISIRAEVTAAAFTTYMDVVEAAIHAGTMDARDDRHVSWTAMHYDEFAWNRMIESTDAFFWRTLEIHEEAVTRIEKLGATAIPVAVSLACFESPAGAPVTPVATLEQFRSDLGRS